MKQIALWFGLCGLIATFAHGNPLVVDTESRPITMIAESVAVTVGESESKIEGIYRFNQEKGSPWDSEATRVTVYVPVFLPLGGGATSKELLVQHPPVVTVAEQHFICEEWNDLSPAGAPGSITLPKGCYSVLYFCRLPLEMLTPTFEIGVSYRQPHLPGAIAAYVPLRPPQDQEEASSVTFTGEPGVRLKRPSFLSRFGRSKPSFSFVPKDRELLRVRAIRSSTTE